LDVTHDHPLQRRRYWGNYEYKIRKDKTQSNDMVTWSETTVVRGERRSIVHNFTKTEYAEKFTAEATTDK
jgi:hypothetical protein